MDKDDEALLDRLIEIICGEKMMGAESELLNLKRDALRYRWLNRQHNFLIQIEDRPVRLRCGLPLDEWIDSRIKEEKP